jgi:hypothetical protein
VFDAAASARYAWKILTEGLCALRGHDLQLAFQPRRLFLRCDACGYETPGWTIDPPHYRRAVTTSPEQTPRRSSWAPDRPVEAGRST